MQKTGDFSGSAQQEMSHFIAIEYGIKESIKNEICYLCFNCLVSNSVSFTLDMSVGGITVDSEEGL